MNQHTDVLVIGAGIGGLTAAFELTRMGKRPLVIDAFRWAGGVVGRHVVAGLTLDAGADAYAVATPSVTELITDLGMADQIEKPNPKAAWVRYAGGSAPLPVGGSLGIPGNPLADDVVAILGEEGAARAAEDRTMAPDVGFDEGVTTLGGLVRTRMGDLVVERLVEPVVGGVHSADPDLLDVDVISPRLRGAMARAGCLSAAVAELRGGAGSAGSAVAGLKGGLYRLVDALIDAITAGGGRVEYQQAAQVIRRTDSGWSTQVTGPDGTVDIDSAGVIIAVPGAAAADLLVELDPEASTLLRDAPSCHILLVTLVLDAPELDQHPRGTGVLVSAHCTDVRAKALTHATAKWQSLADEAGPGRHVLRLSYGRDGVGIPAREDAVSIALQDASTMLGADLSADQLVESDCVVWRQGMPRADALHAARVSAARAAMSALPTMDMVGAFTAGTGLAAIVADARVRAAALFN